MRKPDVYLTGASRGGHGTCLLATEQPHRFAAIAPVCPATSPRYVAYAPRVKLAELRRLGVWAFHCDRDPTVPLSVSKELVDAFHMIGARDIQLTIFRSDRHDAWTKAYSSLELYAWLLNHARPDSAAKK